MKKIDFKRRIHALKTRLAELTKADHADGELRVLLRDIERLRDEMREFERSVV